MEEKSTRHSMKLKYIEVVGISNCKVYLITSDQFDWQNNFLIINGRNETQVKKVCSLLPYLFDYCPAALFLVLNFGKYWISISVIFITFGSRLYLFIHLLLRKYSQFWFTVQIWDVWLQYMCSLRLEIPPKENYRVEFQWK